jgi:hypothetical protein
MQITSIKFLKRIQTAQYEHEEVELTATLHEGDSAREGLEQLKQEAYIALGLFSVAQATEPTPPAKEEKPKQTRAKKEPAPGKEEPKKETLASGQEIPPTIPSEDASGSGETKVVGRVDTANGAPAKSEASEASPSVAGKGIVAYDSTVKEHRSRFAAYLNTNFPKWTPDIQHGKAESPAKSAYAAKVQTFSKGLHGKAFEDAKGNMLDSFKTEIETFFAHAK